ncbi:ubiquitin carboxyl-terminal hydrolase 8 [Lathyrus oleraceus]|uniref:ubiquitin carboxyl-terminal hydrolase 8 n=1 Tax=Pisum sativum TaxID=3888 RepID=UPI0021CF5109|nr:ubiquitin carboxyl-terminal hydrolase 8-like [Pisum sativum]
MVILQVWMLIHSLRALKRYNDFNNAVKDFGRLFYAEDCLPDLFPLQLRIFVSWETSSLVAKISQKENVSDFYKKAWDIFNSAYSSGELALAFGDLLRMLWVPGASPVAPRLFKMKLANFAPQFSGYMQHDSQELLAFLLDGLHEDLNRVKRKPYHEVKDADGRPDEEVAEEYWRNHLARNHSIVVDLCQGQFRSTLICPFCKKVSITFDPFMYLSLPLPSTTIRTMTVTVVSSDGVALPSAITVTVPERGTIKDLIGALTASCSMREDETLLVAEIYRNRIFRVLEGPSDLLADIRDQDKLVAYRVQKYNKDSLLIVFIHERLVER